MNAQDQNKAGATPASSDETAALGRREALQKLVKAASYAAPATLGLIAMKGSAAASP